uniref:Putative secreted protein n=1 Tax=Anopheles marajoara TaxID=58244 RepID=A0A2M4CD51_9DIPT
MPSRGLVISSCMMVCCWRVRAERSRKWRNTRETTLFSSSSANFWPMQFRGPALNGMYAYGWRCSVFSGRNRSGS